MGESKVLRYFVTYKFVVRISRERSTSSRVRYQFQFVGILVVGALTRCALFHTVCNLIAAQLNVQLSLTDELRLCKFELVHNVVETTRIFCSVDDEGAVDDNILIRNFTWDAEISTLRQGQIGIESWLPRPCSKTNAVINILRVSGERGSSKSRVVGLLYTSTKASGTSINKRLQNI